MINEIDSKTLFNEYGCQIFQSEFIDTHGIINEKKWVSCIPVAKGLVFKRFRLILVEDVNYSKSKKDPAREKGANKNRSESFAEVIRNGDYTPLSCIPPVFDEDTKELPNGRTRYVGHIKAKCKYILVAEVEFIDFEGKPAAYWRDVYASNANEELKKRVDDSPRTPGDIAFNAAATLLKNKILFVKLNKKKMPVHCPENSLVVWDTLKDLGQTDNKVFWLEQTWSRILKNVECIETYSPEEAVNKIGKILGDINISFTTPSKTNFDDDDNLHVIKKFQPTRDYTDRNYDIELYELVDNLNQKYPDSIINVYIHFDKLEASRLDEARAYKLNKMFLTKYNRFTRKEREKTNTPDYTDMNELFPYIKFNILPQKSISEATDDFIQLG